MTRPRCIVFHLPQFHPIPENDEWWGKGFTEWTNTAKAKPLFPGHYQPHIPADLGFYDLRLPESRQAQAELAKAYGIEGFCYYHYWFDGRQILNKPVEEILRSGKPEYPFCLCWANETWSGVWHGLKNKVLIQQTYPGNEDHIRHFNHLLPAFSDQRYIKVDGRPLFLIYKPQDIPNCKRALELWREMAIKSNLNGLFLVGVTSKIDCNHQELGLDGLILQQVSPRRRVRQVNFMKHLPLLLASKIFRFPTIYSYKNSIDHLLPDCFPGPNWFPCAIPNWDNSPRSGKKGLVLHGSTPEIFREHFQKACQLSKANKQDRNLIFIKSWNEWAEGNHLEPDLKFGHKYLEVVSEELNNV